MFDRKTDKILDGLQKPTYEVKPVQEPSIGNPDTDMKSPDPICESVKPFVNPLTLQEEFDTHGISTPAPVQEPVIDDSAIEYGRDLTEGIEKEPSGVDGEIVTELKRLAPIYADKDYLEFKQTLDKLYRRKIIGEMRNILDKVFNNPNRDCDIEWRDIESTLQDIEGRTA